MSSPQSSPSPLKRSRSDAGGPPTKKQCSNDRRARCRPEESPTKSQTSSTLERILRRLSNSVDFATLRALKGVASASSDGDSMAAVVQCIIEHAQDMVEDRCHRLKGKKKLLEGELYLEWLREYDFVLTAVENILGAKVQLAIGKTLFSILFHLIDEYISAVDSYQDGWSHGLPAVPLQRYPWVMTLIEEANDSSTDKRSTAAIQQAEGILERFDAVMARALQRFKAESMDHRRLAGTIGWKQEALARGCCLLSEQTGFGGADDMGFGLFEQTREAMLRWKTQGKTTSRRDDSDCDL